MLGHMKKSLVLVAVATAAGLLPGVHSITLSQGCQSAIEGLLTSPDAACFNPSALLSAVLGSNSGSITNTVNTWLTGICSAGSCTNDSIASVVTDVTSGCSTELASLGISVSNVQSDVISAVQAAYPTVREIACTQDDTTNQLCVVETLNNLEAAVGQVNVTDLNILNLFSTLANDAESIACTDCMKESFSIAKSNFPSLVSQAEPDAEALCGASFVDGTLPTTVSQTANDAVFSASSAPSSNHAGSLKGQVLYTAFGPSLTVLCTVFAAFALLG